MYEKAGFTTPKKYKTTAFQVRLWRIKTRILFPYLAVYDTEASLPVADVQPAAKRVKTCNDLDGNSVERRLKFSTVHRLLSYSLCTNVPGCVNEFFACHEGDTEIDIKSLVKKIVDQLLVISEKFLMRWNSNTMT